MPTTNRYAPPKAPLEEGFDSGGELWRDGKVLVLRKGSDFPDRCIKCNEPSVWPRRHTTLVWHPVGWYLLLPMILLYIVVSLVVRRRTVVNLGLCASHQRRVLWGRMLGWGGFATLVAMVVVGSQTGGTVGVLAFLLLLPWALASILVSRQVVVLRIDSEATRMKGCGAAFLASLPDLPAR